MQVRLTEMSYEAAAFVDDLRSKFTQQFPEHAAEVEWRIAAENVSVSMDPQQLQVAMLELLGNAFQHSRGDGRIEVSAAARNEAFIIEVREPKTAFTGSTENWGREPFAQLKHGHYSLGLTRARSIVEAHRGTLKARYDGDAGVLVTTVTLPLGGDA
jgi:signal transduction histidine kinase